MKWKTIWPNWKQLHIRVAVLRRRVVLVEEKFEKYFGYLR